MTATSPSPHSWASTRAADRREARALEARLAREDADAAARRRLEAETARGDKARADRDHADQRRTERATARAAARAQRRTKALTWASTHVVELLIYPIALLSFALAAPAMAAYGQTIYGPLGVLLAGITELGMWAFALAVLASRHQHPTRSVVGLQVGVVVFALVAAGMNLAHGLEQGPTAGVVMAVVSIAGVAAHQLTLAGTPRSRTERRAAHRAGRLDRLVEVKTDRARRLAVADATAVIGPDGTATLAYRPGTYRIARRALAPTGPMTATATAAAEGQDSDGDGDWDAALTALTRGHLYDPWTDPDLASRVDPWVDSHLDDDLGGGVDLLDPPAPELGGESRPDLQQSRSTRSSSRAGVDPDHDLETGSTPRSLNDLRRQLRAAVGHGRVDPSSAESIRRVLRCSAARARHLRDEHRDESGGDQR
ncbi:hypothetical protein Ae717Ps2_7087 [Pseudonocardia sp. Ae717_Ps2]|uniref:hypothetical protein n=1 Tax=Pseudonocardia sp. Ae717_Ps2 TaxID=1885573 RepID=UPI00094B628D|nr:hypothetical protein [Pseudonocardia sp. Ae717_Ps2]OLM27869.1 hypothetical protein Ae717Ps2_7087 [Pseudonocardia sp. Ae717_Ps2]